MSGEKNVKELYEPVKVYQSMLIINPNLFKQLINDVSRDHQPINVCVFLGSWCVLLRGLLRGELSCYKQSNCVWALSSVGIYHSHDCKQMCIWGSGGKL